jgi:hypothetical protein
MLKVIEFINRNKNWEELLAQKPFSIIVKTDELEGRTYKILSYNQLESDFNEPMVRECRGLIIRKIGEAYKPICVPFFKFGNYGESYCPEIDWNSAVVQEKLDGSLCKLWFDKDACKGWFWSTNNTIDAKKAQVGDKMIGPFPFTFYDLIVNTMDKNGYDYANFDVNCTYMFELCCWDNRVVVPHKEDKIYHIGTRNNQTLEEVNVDIGIPKPKVYPLGSIEQCIEVAKTMKPNEHEGFIVLDKHWNRVKIKSPAYVAISRMHNNGIITTERIIDLIRTNEKVEFLTYFPEYTDLVYDVDMDIQRLEYWLLVRITELEKQHFETQKDYAFAVKEDRFSAYYFLWRKTGILPYEWINSLSTHKLAECLLKLK